MPDPMDPGDGLSSSTQPSLGSPRPKNMLRMKQSQLPKLQGSIGKRTSYAIKSGQPKSAAQPKRLEK
jgi:hypothetical protein